MRLTEKNKDLEGIYTFEGLENIEEGAIKLGQLEDLMEKYSIKTLSQVEGSFISFVSDYTEEGRNHIGQLLKLEDELRIDLFTLFKALENGIWCKCCLFDDVKISHRKPDFISLKNKCLVQECDDGSLHSSNYFVYYYFKDYGKTWALTKEELL